MTGWEGKLAMLGLGVGAFALVVVLLLVAVDTWPARAGRLTAQRVLFVGPALVLVGFGLVYPALLTVDAAFRSNDGATYVGLDNLRWMVTEPDSLLVLRNTAIWVLLAPLLSTSIGLLYAILIDRRRGEAVAKLFVFMPMAISFVGAGIIWKFVYAYRSPRRDQIGLLNQAALWLGLTPPEGGYLLQPPWNTLLLIVVMVWIQAGFAMVVLSAALKGIPAEIVEAARLDGVNEWQMFWRVTLPSIRPTVVVVLTTITIGVLKVFDIVRTMTGGNYRTSVVANEMYFQAFPAGQQGYGSALALFLFLLVLPVVFTQVRRLRKQRIEAR